MHFASAGLWHKNRNIGGWFGRKNVVAVAVALAVGTVVAGCTDFMAKV